MQRPKRSAGLIQGRNIYAGELVPLADYQIRIAAADEHLRVGQGSPCNTYCGGDYRDVDVNVLAADLGH